MYERKIPAKKKSGIDITFFVMGGKWKRDIIFCIVKGLRRPSEMHRYLAEASANPRVLRQQLRELEKHGILYKVFDFDTSLKVEYFLTDIAAELVPILIELDKWGEKYMVNHQDLTYNKTHEECLTGISG